MEKMIHAEEDAINKLPCNNKKPIYLSLLVVKINNHECFSNSAPCSACINRIINARKRGYIISKIYYSNKEGKIIKLHISELNKIPKHITIFYQRIRP
jgi:deoxycytidylate deaminase